MTNRLASTSIFASFFVAVIAAGGCTTSSSDSTLTIENEQSVAMTALFVDPVGEDTFTNGNLLGAVPLDPGASIVLSLECDTYDIEIDNEDNTSCIINSYDICASDDEWIINDQSCTFASPREGRSVIVQKTPTVARTSHVAK